MTAPADPAVTEAHRAQQAALAAAMVVELARLWPLLNLANLDASSLWINFIVDLVLRYRSRSITTAATYYDRLRTAQTGIPLPSESHFIGLMNPVNTDAIRASLIATGPASITHRLGLGVDPVRAERTALVTVSGASTRHMLGGHRDFLATAVARDDLALGWARVTGPNPCSFCAMLASRGPVYKSRATALGTQSYHDHCHCTAEPVFSRTQPWPGRAKEFAQLWKDATLGTSGRAALNAFRRAYEKKESAPIPARRIP